ncbi:Amino acid transporter [Izhakiella capsodis]|uniref:Amino acid transporter n=1 Tax=Izhakiella capsodis TaxID=1367852 RepID=A0A1I4V937_9GAMM|nr:APC family permease [Izhakiella capsodis]SFM97678.1 Amino acid transporter [Izhakiella capsodis]
MSDKNSGLLGSKDIIFMNVIAILSLRQIPNVAPYGASAMVLWVLAAFCLFFPLAMVCGELSTGWPKDGGIFVWIKEAFGKRIAWMVVVCFLFSCVLFFPLMLQFGFTALGYMFSAGLAQNKVFIGVGSAVIFWLLTMMNIRGMEWTKIINSISAWCGVFIPSAILILLAIVWLITGHPMQTNYASVSDWIPDLSHWNTIVFLSSMMFAFAGLEVAPMIAGRTRNPQRDFPRAMAFSAAVIVGIYMIGTWALNTLLPAGKTDIVAGVMQAMHSAAATLHMPWLLPVMAICMFFGALGQINSWLVGPIYMLQEASREDNLLGERIGRLHPKYQTPAFALIMQAVIVTLLCFSTFISTSVAAAYWMLTALTTITYFIPYMVMFPAFCRLRISQPDTPRSFKIPGKILPVLLPIMGFISVTFAVFLLFIPPSQINMGGYLQYAGKIIGGALLAFIVAEVIYHRAQKRNAHLASEGKI